jgi:hypothetical protein
MATPARIRICRQRSSKASPVHPMRTFATVNHRVRVTRDIDFLGLSNAGVQHAGIAAWGR